jgi:CHAD domain-containing protein
MQMAENADAQAFVGRLGEVKDAIGEWHDWEVLIAVAKDALDHGGNCKLSAELRKTAEAKYETALRLAEAMRREYLRLTKRSSGGPPKVRSPQPAEPVWSATAALTA